MCRLMLVLVSSTRVLVYYCTVTRDLRVYLRAAQGLVVYCSLSGSMCCSCIDRIRREYTFHCQHELPSLSYMKLASSKEATRSFYLSHDHTSHRRLRRDIVHSPNQDHSKYNTQELKTRTKRYETGEVSMVITGKT